MFDHSDKLDLIAPAIVKAQAEFKAVRKSGENTYDHYAYATLGDYVETVSPVLAKNGISLLTSVMDARQSAAPRPTSRGGQEYHVAVDLHVTLLHESGQYITVCGTGEGQDRADKAVYKAITGARKYALASALGLATTDDPEADETVGTTGGRKTTSRTKISKNAPVSRSVPGYVSGAEAAPETGDVDISQLDAAGTLKYFTGLMAKDCSDFTRDEWHNVCSSIAAHGKKVFKKGTPERKKFSDLLKAAAERLNDIAPTNAD